MEASTHSDGAAEEKDLQTQVREHLAALDVLDRTYFGKDRSKQIKTRIDEVSALLDSRPLEFVQNKREKADLLYLRGKALDFLPEYSKAAEDNLSKAIKLLPAKWEAWDALGHVYWKKRDLAAARKCFEGSLEQSPENKDALRHLSMVLRMLEEPEARKENYRESIRLANKAVALDLGDSQSWYVLGNAHLTNFFVNNEAVGELTLALKAYTQTERLQKEPNPDLYYNRATVFEYLERYNEAVRDYGRAHSIDPNLQADKKAEKIVDFVVHAATLIQRKSKKLSELAKTVPSTLAQAVSFPSNEERKLSYQVAAMSQLQAGENQGAILSAKVVSHLPREQEVPQCFLVVDFKHNFSVVSLYQTVKSLASSVKTGDELLVKNPELIFTSLEFKGKLYAYQTVKVTDIASVLVNGQPLVGSYSPSQLVTSTFT